MFGDYDPEDNATACVYGPPEMLYGEDDVPEEETAITQEEGLSE